MNKFSLPLALLALGVVGCAHDKRDVHTPEIAVSAPTGPTIALPGANCTVVGSSIETAREVRCCLNGDGDGGVGKDECSSGSPEELRYRIALSERTGIPLIMPYSLMAEVGPEAYIEYVAGQINDPRDLVDLFRNGFFAYKEIDQNVLLPVKIVLANGGGDCDNLSNLWRELLDRLGKRQGYNYEAKVLAQPDSEHAVVVFKDRDGGWYALDQGSDPKRIDVDEEGNLVLASSSRLFVPNYYYVVVVPLSTGGFGAKYSYSVGSNLGSDKKN